MLELYYRTFREFVKGLNSDEPLGVKNVVTTIESEVVLARFKA
jgi:hypothetical protein